MLVSSSWASHLCPKCQSPVCAGDWGESRDGGRLCGEARSCALADRTYFSSPVPAHPTSPQVLDTWRDSGFIAPVLRPGSRISLPRPFIPCLPCPILAPMDWIIPDDSCLWAHFPLVAFWKQPLPPTSSGRDTLAFQGSQSMSSEVLSLAVGWKIVT